MLENYYHVYSVMIKWW